MTAPEQWAFRALDAGRVFTPNTPIDEKSVFSGRKAQIRRVIDVVNQKGQHAMIFGERGVGKTSLANVIGDFLGGMGGEIVAPRVNCDGNDTFASTWLKVFDQIELIRNRTPLGFGRAGQDTSTYGASALFGDAPPTPDSVRRVLTTMSEGALPILIVDEFDRLKQEPRRAFADAIKNLSDHAVRATVVLVGVADSVDQLIEEHQSVARALVQIQMPRMPAGEITTIVQTGLQRLEMTIAEDALRRIVLLAQGLPHYAHLIGLHASRVALDTHSTDVTLAVVDQAITKAIEDAQQSIRNAYHSAIRSSRKHNLFGDVLLSCALAKTDELGFFAAQDVRSPMRKITGKDYDIPTFAQHLNEFSDAKRGKILKKTGQTRRYRYRFSDPLMQPFVIMQGVVAHKIPAGFLQQGDDSAA
ncbi:MAG: ATP-binding protein [Gemmatimonadales bacterium]|nr:ATP-binding protein [Gemmatimonadales bacterium]